MNNQIFEKVDLFIQNILGNEDQSLIDATALIESEGIPNASISPNQGKFLQILAKACNAKHILEIGTLGAYSTIWLANAIPDDGKVISIEFDPKHAAIAKKNIENAGLSNIVDIKLGAALDILPEIEKELSLPFDFIFIDADKPPYAEYFQWAIKLGRPGTIIVADNVVRNGKILDPDSNDEKVQGVQRLIKMLPEFKEVTATVIQTVGVKEYDGMVLAVITGN